MFIYLFVRFPLDWFRYVRTVRVRTGRSIKGFRLPPAIEFLERRNVEKVIVKGLLSLEGELAGEYFPLHGSYSYKKTNYLLQKTSKRGDAADVCGSPAS